MRHVRRRAFLLMGAAFLFDRRSALAQVKGKVYRLGVISPVAKPGPAITTMTRRLRELGWNEGENLIVEMRYADGHLERIPSLAAELIRLKVDVLVPLGSVASRATGETTSTIPVVVVGVDPVSAGLVPSLARPGGNITGINLLHGETAAKRLEMLKQVAPRMRRVAVFLDPNEPEERAEFEAVQQAARALSVEVIAFGVSSPADVGKVFTAEDARRVDALFNVGSLGPPRFRGKPILELSKRHRIPAVFGWPGLVQDGGLLSYNIDFDEIFQRAATQIHKILSGAKAGDLPVEQPTKFELVINMRTAKEYGLTVPPALLLRASRVIE